MKIENHYSAIKFDNLEVGDFFIHPLSNQNSPAIKVRRLDGVVGVVDLDMEHINGARVPALVAHEEFEGLTVLAVSGAIFRPAPGLENVTIGSGGAGSPPTGSLLVKGTDPLLKVRGPNATQLLFNLATGSQSTSVDSATCVWWSRWQVCVRDGEDISILFEKK